MTRYDALRIGVGGALVNLAVSAALSYWMPSRHEPVFGTLDVAELYRLKEAQIAAVLVRKDSAEGERVRAIQRAARFGDELSQAIDALPKLCGCLVLARGALLGSDARLIDLTPQVRRQLGLEPAP